MKALFLVLLFPTLAFSQIHIKGEQISAKSVYNSPNVQPVDVQNGNVVNAQYEIVHNVSGKKDYFYFVIYTYSYRDALQPSDDAALFTVDGLGKVFEIQYWTSRYELGKVMSSIVIRMSTEEVKSISYAGTVGVKIGANAFSISHMARYKMRQMITQVKFQSGNQAGFNSSTAADVSALGNRDGKRSFTAKVWSFSQQQVGK